MLGVIKTKSFLARISLKIINEIKSKIKFESPYPDVLPQGLDKRKSDNLILSIALKFKNQNVIVVTSDLAMKVKSEPLSINIWDPEIEIQNT